MNRTSFSSLALLATPLVLWMSGPTVASAADEPMLSNVATRSLPLVVDDLKVVASARLYVTADNGATWAQAEEVIVVPGLTPRFTFTAPADGVYGFASAITFTNGNREAEPVPGTEPDLRLQIDTKAPIISTFTATALQQVQGHLQLRLDWVITDSLLDAEPITIEVSLDGGASFAPLKTGGPSGSVTTTLAIPAGTAMVHARLAAKDRAGNLAVSATQAIPVTSVVPVAPAPTTAVIAVAPVAPTPEVAPVAPVAVQAEADTAALATALAALPKPQPEPAPTVAAAIPAPAAPVQPAIDPNRPDIVVPNAPVAQPEQLEVVKSGGTDQELAALNSQTTEPAAGTGWQRQGRQPDATAPAAKELAPIAPPKVVAPPREAVLPPGIPPAGRLSPSQANQLLQAARDAAAAKKYDLASERYRILRNSNLSESAINEEIRMYRESGNPAKARSVIASLRPAERTESIIIEDGRCLLSMQRPVDAMQVLTQVNAQGPFGGEAFFVIAQSLHQQGRDADAIKVFAHVAQGQGPWADAAKAALLSAPAPKTTK